MFDVLVLIVGVEVCTTKKNTYYINRQLYIDFYKPVLDDVLLGVAVVELAIVVIPALV